MIIYPAGSNKMKKGPNPNISTFIDSKLDGRFINPRKIDQFAASMAHDLKAVSLQLFQNVEPNDFHRLNTVKSETQPAPTPLDSRSPIIQMSDMAKSLTSMVASDILLAKNDAHRMKVFEFYIRVLEHAVKNGDYNTAFGISGGLVVNSVDRLKLKEQNPALADALEKNAVVHWTTKNYQQAINEKAKNSDIAVIPNIASAYIKVTATVAGNKESDVTQDEKISVIRNLTDQVINDHIRPFTDKARSTIPEPTTLNIHGKLNEPVLKEDVSQDNQKPDPGSFEERSYQIKPFGGVKATRLPSKEEMLTNKMANDIKDHFAALYQKIQPAELLYDLNKSNEAKNAPNLVAIVKDFNNLAATIRDNILLSDSSAEFAKKYKQAVELVVKSIENKNFIGASAILSGLEHFSIDRLASNNPDVKKSAQTLAECNAFLTFDNGANIKKAIETNNDGQAIVPFSMFSQQIDRASQAYRVNDEDSPEIGHEKNAKMEEISGKVQNNFLKTFDKIPPIEGSKINIPGFADPKLDDQLCAQRSLEIRSKQKNKQNQNSGILFDSKRPLVTPSENVRVQLKAPVIDAAAPSSQNSTSAAAGVQSAAPVIDYANDPNHKGKERDEPAPTATATTVPEPKPVVAEPKPAVVAPKASREQRLLQSVLNHAFKKSPSAEKLAKDLESGKPSAPDKPTRTRGTVNVHAKNGAEGEILRFRINKAENIAALKAAFENEGVSFKTSRTKNHTVFEISASEFVGKDKKSAQSLATSITMQRAHLVEVVAARQEAAPPDLSKLAALLDAKPAQITAPLASTNSAPAGFEPRARRQLALATTVAVKATADVGTALEVSLEQPKTLVAAFNKDQQASKSAIHEGSSMEAKKGFFEQFTKKADDAIPKTETKRSNKM